LAEKPREDQWVPDTPIGNPLAFALTLQGVQPCIVLAKRAGEVLDIVAKSMDLSDEVGCQTVDFFVKFGDQASLVLTVKQYAQ
jgi:hypothetical protein